jgi:inosose dehydratase
MNAGLRVAGAPISWGVCEVPDWGYQMDAETVLSEMASLGLSATEAGPEEFLPEDQDKVSRLLDRHGLRLVGGFVPAVLHRADLRERELASVRKQAELFAAAGAEVLVLAASTGQDGYEETTELDDSSWEELFEGLAAVEEICAGYGLIVTLHHHFGTVIERPHQVERFLEGCGTGLCLDTGHYMVGGGDPVELAESARERINHVHLKDVDGRLAEQVAEVTTGYEDAVRRGLFKPLGEGDVDVERVIRVLQSAGYGGWYVLEQDVMLPAEPDDDGGPVIEVRKSLAFLKGLGKQAT